MDQAGMGGDRAAPEAIIGYGWLDSITPRSASCHFCVRKWAWGKVAREAGLLVNRYWFSFQGEDGPCFHVLLGMVAADNRHAIRFIRDIGWHEVGRVPKFLHGLKDGILFYRTRD